MECTCAQTRPRFILSSERVLNDWSQNPCLLQGEKSLCRKKSHQRRIEPTPLHPQHTSNELFRPPCKGLTAGCLTSQQHASISQGRICSDKCTCCHTEMEVEKKNLQKSCGSILLSHPVTLYGHWANQSER